MKQAFGQTLPDMIGFIVVGATAGAVLMGAADNGVTTHSVIGCLGGGLLGPAAKLLPRARPLRAASARRSEAVHG